MIDVGHSLASGAGVVAVLSSGVTGLAVHPTAYGALSYEPRAGIRR